MVEVVYVRILLHATVLLKIILKNIFWKNLNLICINLRLLTCKRKVRNGLQSSSGAWPTGPAKNFQSFEKIQKSKTKFTNPLKIYVLPRVLLSVWRLTVLLSYLKVSIFFRQTVTNAHMLM
jgi:hypothetical protein